MDQTSNIFPAKPSVEKSAGAATPDHLDKKQKIAGDLADDSRADDSNAENSSAEAQSEHTDPYEISTDEDAFTSSGEDESDDWGEMEAEESDTPEDEMVGPAYAAKNRKHFVEESRTMDGESEDYLTNPQLARYYWMYKATIVRMCADARGRKIEKDEDIPEREIVDFNKDEGGRYDLVPDPEGTVVQVAPGIYKDVRSKIWFERCKTGHKSRAQFEGKAVRAIEGEDTIAAIEDRYAAMEKELSAEVQKEEPERGSQEMLDRMKAMVVDG